MLNVFLSLLIAFTTFVCTANAARDTDSYDGNIYPIYAGNGSLVPPNTSISDSLANGRASVIIYYLDDSATSKQFAPVVSGINLLWSSSIDLIPLTTDELQNNDSKGTSKDGYFWRGKVPQVVVLNGKGEIILDQEGQVPIEVINKAISEATGLPLPSYSISIKTFNEYNSEPSKEGYTDPR